MKFPAILTIVASIAITKLEAKDFQPFIVGGVDAGQNEFPFLVSIWIGDSSAAPKELKCSGVLVKENVVLTAARCVHDADMSPIPIGNLEIVAGDHNARENDDGEVKAGVIKIVAPEKWNPWLNENDVALLHLSEDLVLSDAIKLATLALVGVAVPEGGSAVIIGWGEVSPALNNKGAAIKAISDILQKADLTVSADSACMDKFGAFSFNPVQNLCAGSPTSAACTGDQGSPLLIMEEGVSTVYGLLSNPGRCEKDSVGGLFTKVGPQIEWITENLRDDPEPTTTTTSTAATTTATSTAATTTTTSTAATTTTTEAATTTTIKETTETDLPSSDPSPEPSPTTAPTTTTTGGGTPSTTETTTAGVTSPKYNLWLFIILLAAPIIAMY